MNVIPPAFSWESQACQYAYRDAPGIGYERHSTAELGARLGEPIAVIDCLLYRDEQGLLIGILNYYPDDNNELEQAGNANIWVRPDRQRRGIGSALLGEAMKRWNLDLEAQRYTRDGVLFLDGLIKKGLPGVFAGLENGEGW